ncbi:MAG: hypothetical protein IJ514_05600 [Clostridia bacterium]|nr:hypothetical protein [Clostridia bacterium]
MKRKNLMKVFVSLAAVCVLAGGAAAIGSTEASATGEPRNITIGETTVDIASFATSAKASVRYDSTTDENGKEYTGMRFFSGIDESVYNALTAIDGYTVSFGTVIASPTNVAKAIEAEGDFTIEALQAAGCVEAVNYLNVPAVKFVPSADKENADDVEFSAVIREIPEDNFNVARQARAYMTVTNDEDSSSVTYYASYTGEARSVAYVAMEALKANAYETEAVDANEKQFKALNRYAQKSDEWQAKYDGYDYIRYIDTLDELQAYATDDILKADDTTGAKVCLVQNGDIDLSGATWTLRTASTDTYPNSVIVSMTQSLDGNGYTMTGLTKIDDEGGERNRNMGFFGNIASTSTIRNVIFKGTLGINEEGDLPSNGVAGIDEGKTNAVRGRAGIFAYKNSGVIENCYIQGKIYSANGNQAYGLIGAVYHNLGTVTNTVTDILVAFYNTSATIDESAAGNARKYGFAVANAGTISNCVTVSFATISTTTGGNATTPYYDWMSNVPGSKIDAFSISDYLDSSVPNWSGNDKAKADSGRTNSYIFTSYESLASSTGTGYGYKSTSALDDTITSETAHTALGDAWTYDESTGKVMLNGVAVN